MQLLQSLQAWRTPQFDSVLKQEIEDLDATSLPLQEALTHSSYTMDGRLNVMVISKREELEFIRVNIGVFYSGLIPGCACENDPTPMTEYPEYCELQLDISKTTAAANIMLLSK